MAKRFFAFIVAILALFTLSVTMAESPQSAQAAPAQPSTQQPILVPSAPNVNAKAYVLMDTNTGRIIAQKNMDQKQPPASLTKMMTLYLTSQSLQTGAIKLDDTVQISEKAWKMGGSKMFVKVGDHVPVQDLIQGIIVDSGNDSCVAMAQYIGGTEENFAKMMNDQAKLLGMTNSNFTDSTGLPNPNHYTTAHDLATLARALILNFPQYYSWYKEKWFTYNGIKQPNRNRLLWRYDYADGIKTGHTDAAGFCIVASAKKDDMRLIVVILGAPTDNARADDAIRLLNYGFRFYNTHLVYQGGTTVATPRVWGGATKTVPAGVTNDLYIVAPRAQFQTAEVTLDLAAELQAPISKGQTVGQVIVTLNKQVIDTQPLVALSDDARGNIFRRFIDHILHLFHKWFGIDKNRDILVDLQAPPPATNTITIPTTTNVTQDNKK